MRGIPTKTGTEIWGDRDRGTPSTRGEKATSPGRKPEKEKRKMRTETEAGGGEGESGGALPSPSSWCWVWTEEVQHQPRLLPGLDKDGCQRKAGEGKTFTNPQREKPGRLPQAPENNGYLTLVGH